MDEIGSSSAVEEEKEAEAMKTRRTALVLAVGILIVMLCSLFRVYVISYGQLGVLQIVLWYHVKKVVMTVGQTCIQTSRKRKQNGSHLPYYIGRIFGITSVPSS